MSGNSADVDIFRSRFLVRGIDESSKAEIVENGAAACRGGKIVAIGPFNEIRAQFPGASVTGDDNVAIIPGFVNGHHHVGITPLQMGAMDAPLELWREARMRELDRDPYLDTLYGAMDMVKSGITTVQHIRGSQPMGTTLAENVDGSFQIIRAYTDVGMRVSYSSWSRDQNHLAYESNDSLAARLTGRASEYVKQFQQTELEGIESIQLFRLLRDEYASNEFVEIQLSPANLHWCSDDLLREIERVSAAFGVGMHMHLLETVYQREYAHLRTGKSAVEHLAHLGLLGPRLTLGHATWASEQDVELIADTGTRVCHNCSSNLRLRSGIAPLIQFLNAGVPVAIGIDEAGINDDHDMLQELRLILHLHREPGFDPRMVPTAAHVFKMATEHGAMTTPFGSTIGRLDVGTFADLVMINWNGTIAPWVDASIPVLDVLVRRAKMKDLARVVVAGRTVLEDGEIVGVDEGLVHAELRQLLDREPTQSEMDRRAIAAELGRRLPDVYEGYAGPSADLRPHSRMNAR